MALKYHLLTITELDFNTAKLRNFEHFISQISTMMFFIYRLIKSYLLISVPENIIINGLECSDKQAMPIAEHFNSFFATVGELNSRNITEHNDSSYRDYLSERIESSFDFRLVDSHDVKQIIKRIETSRSNGHDGISSELIKLISCDIADSITLIINQSLKSGIFPDQLKIAKVTPIYKKDDKKINTNYRPISALTVVRKVFETVIHEQLSDYFSSNNLFSAQQYGFRKNSSTELAALELINRLLAQLKNHVTPINFHLDLAKAFDSLTHDILLDKLAVLLRRKCHCQNTLKELFIR